MIATHHSLPRILALLLTIALYVDFTKAAIECQTDEDCVQKLQKGSTCNTTSNTCTNPFASGCLLNVLDDQENITKYTATESGKRICNSDDEPGSELCEEQDSRLNYLEIRISPGNWESAIFYSWMKQILLSEFLGVPVTIETSGAGPSSFYDIDNALSYNEVPYNFDALEEANKFNCNCSLTNEVSLQNSMSLESNYAHLCHTTFIT